MNLLPKINMFNRLEELFAALLLAGKYHLLKTSCYNILRFSLLNPNWEIAWAIANFALYLPTEKEEGLIRLHTSCCLGLVEVENGRIIINTSTPDRQSSWVCQNSYEDFQEFARTIRERVQRTGYSAQEIDSRLQSVRRTMIIGDSTCAFNARSPHLRCAVNPSGPCENCAHYQKK